MTKERLDPLEARAMKLNARSRARLAERLIQSLPDSSDIGIQRAWAEEAIRRVLELQERPSIGRPVSAVLSKARRRIKSRRTRRRRS
jgi:hypothetical protein